MSTTCVAVELHHGRHRARLQAGQLRPLLMGSDEDGCTVGLVATGALLLGGDDVQICIEVGPGARLDLRDIAGTVAYDGRGAPSGWDVRVVVGPGAALRWAGEPFVVADGAGVVRSLRVEAAASAQVQIRETLVLGRFGEAGGRLSNSSEAVVDGVGVYREDLSLLDPDERAAPGMLGGARVIDSVLSLRRPGLSIDPTESDLPPVERVDGAVCHRFTLVGGVGTMTRFLGPDLASSPVHRLWKPGGT